MEIHVFGAHPDDEHGMSGTIYRFSQAGHTVRYICTTDSPTNGEQRRNEMQCSAKVLGIKHLHWLGEPDGALYVTPETTAKFNALLDALPKPDVVFVMWAVDVHPDHRRTADLVLTRNFQRGVNTPMFAYALNSSGRAYSFIRPQTTAFFPTHYSDVTAVVGMMKVADSWHVSQDAPAMWNGVEANLRGRAKELQKIRYQNKKFELFRRTPEFVEAFVYMTRFGDLPEWLNNFLEEPNRVTLGIPFPVTAESVGLK